MADDTVTPDLDVSREMAASPRQIWSAWIDPAAIARWWGPDGFTSTVRELEVREGGRFDVLMQGPDRSTFDNVYVFGDVEAGKRITYVHQGSPAEAHGGLPGRRSAATPATSRSGRRRSVGSSPASTSADH